MLACEFHPISIIKFYADEQFTMLRNMAQKKGAAFPVSSFMTLR